MPAEQSSAFDPIGPVVLIACEESQAVCKAFREKGFNAYSCDLQKCSGDHPEWHIIADAREVVKGWGGFPLQSGEIIILHRYWDMIIAHPPCTMLTKSSAVTLAKGLHTAEMISEAREFFLEMLNAPSPLIAVENPVPLHCAKLPPYSQVIQPWFFGHEYTKATCLWLKGLPPLLPTHAKPFKTKQYLNHCSKNSKRRSKTFPGIATAMATQWSDYLL